MNFAYFIIYLSFPKDKIYLSYRKLNENLIFLGYLDVKPRFYMVLTRNIKGPEIDVKRRPEVSTVFSVNAQRRLQYSKG